MRAKQRAAIERVVAQLRKGMPQGLKPRSFGGDMRPEAEASGYLEAEGLERPEAEGLECPEAQGLECPEAEGLECLEAQVRTSRNRFSAVTIGSTPPRWMSTTLRPTSIPTFVTTAGGLLLL